MPASNNFFTCVPTAGFMFSKVKNDSLSMAQQPLSPTAQVLQQQ
jgi:hypothetical protein